MARGNSNRHGRISSWARTAAFGTLCAVGTGACASTPTPAPVAPDHAPVAHPTVSFVDEDLAAERDAAETWRVFLDRRQAYLDRLALPLIECAEHTTSVEGHVSTECTAEDWSQRFQSAHALTRIWLHTRNPEHARAAQLAVTPEVVEATRAHLASDGVEADPYAYVWTLMAARTRHDVASVTIGDESLDALAELVAADLDQWLHGLPDHELAHGVLMGAPNSVAWVVQNVYQWAKASGDEELAERMRRFTAERLLDERYDEWCDPAIDSRPEAGELFPPCLHRVLAVLTVMPEREVGPWVRTVIHDRPQLDPIGSASLSSQAALNFSRSWGLWALYQATGETRYKRAYAQHIMTQMEEECWARVASHDRTWIAEFGVYAIDLSYPANDPSY